MTMRYFDVIKVADNYFTRNAPQAIQKVNRWPTESRVVLGEGNESYVIGKCARATFYSKKQIPESNPPDARSHWIFKMGNAVEDAFKEAWKGSGILIHSNYKFYDPDTNISGEIDAMLQDPVTKELVGIEVKSFYGEWAAKEICGGWNWKSRSAEVTLEGLPKTDHFLQALIYLEYWQSDKVTHKIPYWKLVYLGRDHCARRDFDIYLHHEGNKTYPKIITHVFNKKNELQRLERVIYDYSMEDIHTHSQTPYVYLEKNILPPRDYQYYYTDDYAKFMFDTNNLSKTKYDKHLKGDKTGDWQCIAENTLVNTYNGWVPIEEIKDGDLVRTSERWGTVTHTKTDKKKVITLKPYILMDFDCTPDHPIMVTDKNFGNTSYKDASKLTSKDWLVYPIDREIHNRNPLSDDELFLLANFITEGSFHYNEDGNCYKLDFTYNVNERNTAERIVRICKKKFDANSLIRVVEDNRYDKTHTYLTIKVYSKKLVNWIESFIIGRYSYTKKFNSIISHMHPDQQLILYKYMLKQDGAILNMRGSEVENYSTTSQVLALQVQHFLLRNNIIASIVFQKGKKATFGNRVYDSKPLYHVRYFTSSSTNNRKGIIKDDNLYVMVNKVKDYGITTNVYDLSVDREEHNFMTQGGLVHNCRYCSWRDVCYQEKS